MALTGLAIAAALALAKDQMIDQPAAKRKRTLAAETQRLSPWTGMKAEPVEDPNTIGTMMQYGATGAQMGAGYEQSKADAGLKDAMSKRLNDGGGLNSASSGWGSGAATGDNALGGKDMASKLGGQEKAFEAKQPAWFFGANPSPSAQPTKESLAAGPMQGYQPDSGAGYKSLYDAGISPDAPSFWKTSRYAN